MNGGSTSLRVTWTIDAAAGVTAYDVRHIASNATDKGDSNWTVKDDAWTSTAGGALSYNITSLTNDTSYDVQVRAVRNTTDGSWSETAVGTPAGAAGAAPAITSVRAEEQVLTVAWSAPASPPATVTGYGVRHIRSDAADKASDANWTVVSAATSSASLRFYTITGLTNDVGYDVQVRAVTANGNGAWSATATGLPADFPNTLAQAPPIPLNTPIHGHLTGTGDRDWFRLNVGTATELVVYTTGDADTRGYLRNSDNSTRVSNDDSDHDDATLNFKIIRAVGAGTWYLEVRGFSRIDGDYVLRVESRTESTGTSNAPTLSLGGAYEAALDSSSDDDYYKLVIGSSTDVILRSSGPTNTKATLLQSNGTTSITSNENGQLVEGNFDLKGNTNFLIRRSLSAGTYYLKVEDQDGSTGRYTVHAAANSSPGSSRPAASALTPGVAGAGSISSATDADFFSFTLTEPRTVGVTAAGSPAATSGDLLIRGELQDAGGAKLRDYARYRADREVGFRDIQRLEAGTYYIKVTGSTSASREKYVILVYTFDEHDRRGVKCAGGEPRFTDPLANCQWHLHHPGLPDVDVVADLNLQDVWDSYKGEGINVAVVDNSMEYTHPDLSANVNESLNHSYVAGETIENLAGFFGDIAPHGTSVAGIIAAAENGIGVSGVAPRATIYGYNLVKATTNANEADAMTRNMGVTAVSNNSWGPPDNGYFGSAIAIWKRAIDRGVTEGNGGKGISYTWAAGNGGALKQRSTVIDYANLDEYANYWGVIAVGGHDIFGNKTSTSEAGANLWVTGPTAWESSPDWWATRIPNLIAGYPRDAVITTDGGYGYSDNFGGTSAAAPMAAGVVALIRQANPALTWRDVKLILAETSRKVQPDDPRWVTGAPVYLTPGTRYSHSLENGFGALDAKAAVERALAWTSAPALHTLDTDWQTYEALAVPNDDGATSLELTFTIEEEIPFIEYIHIPMAMNHDYFRELQIELVSPSGIVAVVQQSVVINRDYRQHTWEDEVHNFGDAVHLGESTKGVWTLRITDPSSQTDFVTGNDPLKTTSGTFSQWKLQFYGHGNMPGRPAFPDSGAVTAGTRSLTLNWTAPAVTGATAITRYDLRYSSDEGATWTVREGIWQSGNLTYTLTGLASAAEHMVQVRAVNSDGIGLWSESATGTPTVPALAAPAIASVTPSDASLGVVWTAPAAALPGEITSYDLRYILTSADETADSNWTEVSGVWASGPLHYLQASLANASQYDMQVRAVNGSTDPPVNGAWSGTTTGTPAATIDVEVAWVTTATSVAESAGTVTLQASMVTKEAGTLPSAFSMPVTVAVSGPTIAAADFSLASDTVTFAFADFSAATIGGQSRYQAVKDIVITIADDDVDELDEVMTVTLDYPGLVLPHQRGGGASVPVTITSDDEGPVRIGWEDAEVRVDESAGMVTLRAFAVTTQDAAPAAGYALRTTVTTIAGTAVRSSSFTPVTRRITLGASDFTQATVEGQSRYRAVVEVILTITDDSDDEPDEELSVVLAPAGASPPGLAGSPAVARVTITDNDHVPVALSWSTPSPTVAEADGTLVLMAQVTTLVDKAPESGFTVPLTAATADGTATQPADYTAVSESFSFSTGDFTPVIVGGAQRYRAARNIPVTVLADATDEPGETFTVTLVYGAPASHLTGSSAVANVVLRDSNQAQVTLEWDETALTAAEPDTAGGTTTVTLTAVATTAAGQPPDAGFDLDFTVTSSDGTASQPADYAAVSSTESFAVSDFSSVTAGGATRYRATRTFPIAIAHDTADEESETLQVILALSDPSLTYLLLGDAVATVTITDNDHVPVTLSWDDATITVDEAATTITLMAQVTTETDKAPETGFTVGLSVASANDTATAGTDYSAVTDSYSYSPSDFTRVQVGAVFRYRASKAFDVAILHDTADEPDETFTLTFAYVGTDLPPHLKGASAVATVTITDNDHVPVELSWDDDAISVNESAGTFTLTARLTTTTDKAPETGFSAGLSVASVDGTALAPGDYVAVSESFSFTPTDFSAVTVGGAQRYRATKAFTFSVVNDAVDEPGEAFTVTLAYSGAAMPHLTGSSKTANVTLVDTTQATVTLAWQSDSATVDEPPASGGTTTATLTAVATTAAGQPPDAGFDLDFTVTSSDGTASQPADYAAVSSTESFAVSDFSSVTAGGATRYRATRTFPIAIAHDTADEESETLQVTLALSDPSLTYLLLGDAVATVTITDNDHVPVTLSWDDASITVDEAATTITLMAQVTTETDKAPETAFSVGLSVASANDTATAGTDYSAVTDSYSYSPSDFTRVQVGAVFRYRASKAFDVAILHDTADEPDETFTLTFAYVGTDLPPHLKGASAVATVTITDNDHVPVELSWDDDAISVNESAGTFTLTARLTTTTDKAPETGFSGGLSVASANGTALAPGDYAAVSESFSFTPTDFSAVTVGGAQRYRATRAFTFSVVNDTVDEPGEAFTVTLAYSGAAMPHLTGSSKTANVTLVDTTQATVTLAWQSDSATVDEPPASGGTTTATLTAVATTAAGQPPDAGFDLDFTVTSSDGTASQPADYAAVSSTESFAVSDFSSVTAGGATRYRATRTFPIAIAHDTADEESETLQVTLALSDPSLTYLLLGDAVATVTITDNDHVPVTLSWDDASISVDEAATTITLMAQVTTETDKAPETGFTVALSVASANETASAGTDYTAVTDSYSYSPSDFTRVQVGAVFRYRASKAFDVAILHDTEDEPNETFTLTFAYAGMDLPPHLKGASAVATVTITDNDHVPVELSWDDDAISVNESAGTFTLTARLTTTTDKAPETGFSAGLSVASADATALAPGDYAAVSESFSFTPTDFSAVTVGGAQRYRATRAFTFSVVNDTVDEPGEAFTVTLAYSGAAMPHLTGSSKTANVTLVDTTQATVTLAWQSDSATVDEPPASGGTTTATLTAVATTAAGQPPDAGFDLDFTVTSSDGTASQPADYAAVSSTESFAVSDFSSVTAGGATRYRATRTFPVTIAHDTADEESETLQVILALSDPSLTYLLLGDAVATVTITDNDHVPVALGWDNDAVSAGESVATVTLTAQVTTTRDKLPETGFAVDLSVASADMGATAGEDYTGLNSSVTLTPADFTAVDVGGQQRYRASRTYDVPILHDTTDEEDERFTATLAYAGAPQPHLTGSSARATVTIVDDDHVPVTLGWDATQFTVEEPISPNGSSTLTLTVRAVTIKDKQPDAGFTFDYRARTADDGASAPEDYAALSATGTIARSDFARTSVDGQFRWVAEQEHGIAIAYDTTDEPVENFTATLAYVTPGMPHLLDGDLQATVSITDDLASLADLQTTVTPSAASVMRGDQLTYSWTIENSGPAASTTTALTLILDPQMTFVSATPAAQCMEDEAVVTCAIGVIEKDTSVSGTVVAEVDAAAAADIAFSAAARGDQLERTPGDNEASLATTLVAPPEPVADLRAFATRAYVDLRWTTPQDNGSPITAYELERKAGDEAFTAVGEPPEVEETTWRDEDVELNTTYVYRLRAVNEDGSAAWSEEVSATPRVPAVFIGGGGGGPTPSELDFEWTVKRDIDEFDSGHDTASGLWSDGATLWVLENGDGTDDAVYAYDVKTGERVEDREFELADTNRAPRGVWSDRSTVWVSDSGRNRLFAHDLESGERLEERDIALAGRNRDARGIWSGDETMWVLDGGKDSLFAYDLASGELLGEYELASANGDPHGVWSDGVTVWVSDHGAKRLFAYRLPARPEAPAAEDAEPQALERVSDEEFKELSKASNNSPRGLWSDGDVMYVADASDAKVYSYNMPNAIDARLSSLSLSGVDIGEFSPLRYDYASDTIPNGNIATLTATRAQPGASLQIEPPDQDGDLSDGYQLRLLPGLEITITVTSPDGSRERVYRLRLGPEEAAGPAADCLRGAVSVGFSLVVYAGGSVGELVACAEGRNVTALYALEGGEYVSYTLGAPEFVNEDFRALFADGVPALTPLTVKSDGPATAAPVASAVTGPWATCLQGEIGEGFNLVVYEGGSVDDLATCAQRLGVSALYVLDDSEYVSYILGAPEFVNRSFRELFTDGVPIATLVAASDGPPGGGSGQDGKTARPATRCSSHARAGPKAPPARARFAVRYTTAVPDWARGHLRRGGAAASCQLAIDKDGAL